MLTEDIYGEDSRLEPDDPTPKTVKGHHKFLASLYRSFKSGGCARCEERDPCCIEAHHLNPHKKSFTLAPSLLKRPYPTVQAYMDELAKCMPLCGNCHRKEHKAQRERLRAQRERDQRWIQREMRLTNKSGWRPP